MDAAVVPPHLYAVYPSSAFPRVLSPSSLPLSSEDFRRLSPSHASCRRLRRVPVCGPVHRAYCCGNCFHIKHKKCKILCYEQNVGESPCIWGRQSTSATYLLYTHPVLAWYRE